MLFLLTFLVMYNVFSLSCMTFAICCHVMCCMSCLSVVFKFISKEISRAEHEYMNIHPSINALVSALIPQHKVLSGLLSTCDILIAMLVT